MQVLSRATLPGAISAVALSPAGDRVAVVSSAAEKKSGANGKGAQSLSILTMGGGVLQTEQVIPLRALSRGEVKVPRARPQAALFRDGSSVVVARVTSKDFEEAVEVLAVDLGTGRQHGRTLDLPYPYHVSGLLPGPPGQLFLGTSNTVVCLDARELSEVCRVRPVNEDGEGEDEDAVPEEGIGAGGFTWAPGRGVVSILTGCFETGVLSEYQISPDGGSFERRLRRDVFATRPRMGSDLPAAGGIALSPDGSGVAAEFKLDDLRLDLWGAPVTDAERARARALAEHTQEGVPLPTLTRVGWLALFGERSDAWMEIMSDTERDIAGDTETEETAEGETVVVGYHACSTDPWDPAPVYADERRVAIVSPTGLVQLLDTATGRATLEHDAGGPVGTMQAWPEERCLLVGGADGTLTALGFTADAAPIEWQGARATVPIEPGG